MRTRVTVVNFTVCVFVLTLVPAFDVCATYQLAALQGFSTICVWATMDKEKIYHSWKKRSLLPSKPTKESYILGKKNGATSPTLPVKPKVGVTISLRSQLSFCIKPQGSRNRLSRPADGYSKGGTWTPPKAIMSRTLPGLSTQFQPPSRRAIGWLACLLVCIPILYLKS